MENESKTNPQTTDDQAPAQPVEEQETAQAAEEQPTAQPVEEQSTDQASEDQETAQPTEEQEPAQSAAEKQAAKLTADPKTKKPRDKKKIGITLAIVAVILIVGGIGFYQWHETPGFCDAICHNPQDPYNPTYYAEPGKAATDKWGNEVKDASGMMAVVHRTQANSNCLSCHQPTMVEQIVEGFEWATGNFYNPLSERSLDNLVRWHDGMDGTEFCLNKNCHNLTKSELTTKTADMTRNVHSWHHSEYTCSDCHKSHRASIVVCTQCHVDVDVPQGWLSFEESQALKTQYLPYDLEKTAYGE